MDCHSVSFPGGGEKDEWRVDVPMRSFQGGTSPFLIIPVATQSLVLTTTAGYYTQLIKLYQKLGVTFSKRGFTYSFVRLSESVGTVPTFAPNFIYNGANGLRGVSLPSSLKASATSFFELSRVYMVFAFSTLVVLAAYVRLLWLCAPPHRHADISTLTLDEWTTRTIPRGVLARSTGAEARWRAFVADVLVPLFSAVCTAPAEDVWNHPAEELLG
jgi:hypothetical protein